MGIGNVCNIEVEWSYDIEVVNDSYNCRAGHLYNGTSIDRLL